MQARVHKCTHAYINVGASFGFWQPPHRQSVSEGADARDRGGGGGEESGVIVERGRGGGRDGGDGVEGGVNDDDRGREGVESVAELAVEAAEKSGVRPQSGQTSHAQENQAGLQAPAKDKMRRTVAAISAAKAMAGSGLGRRQLGAEWLPRCRGGNVSADELRALATTADSFGVDVEIVKVAHDVLDMVEDASAGSAGLDVATQGAATPATTAAYLEESGKHWGADDALLAGTTPGQAQEPALVGEIASSGPAAQGAEEKRGWWGGREAELPTKLPVYVTFSVGLERAKSRVVINDGLLEKGCLGGEWHFDNEELVLDCTDSHILVEIFLKREDFVKSALSSSLDVHTGSENIDDGVGGDDQAGSREGVSNRGEGDKEGDVLLGSAQVAIAHLSPGIWKTPNIQIKGNREAMLLVKMKLQRAMLHMPLDDERRRQRQLALAPPLEAIDLPTLRARHTTPAPLQQQILADLKLEIVAKAAQVYKDYPAAFAGMSSSAPTGAARGQDFVTIVLDGLGPLGDRVRRDLLENLAALHYFDHGGRLAHLVAARPSDRVSLEEDHLAGYRAAMSTVCVGRERVLAQLLERVDARATDTCPSLVVGAQGSGKSAVLAALDQRLREQASGDAPTVVSVYCGGMLSPVHSVEEVLYWLLVRLGEQTGLDVSMGASSWAMAHVELPAEQAERVALLTTRGIHDLKAMWLRFLDAARHTGASLHCPSTAAPAMPARSLGAVAPVTGQSGAARRRQQIVVIVDGLDEMPVPDVSWVPWVLPPSLQLVLSCHDGGGSGGAVGGWLHALTAGGRVSETNVLVLEPLSLHARKELVAAVLTRPACGDRALGVQLNMSQRDQLVEAGAHGSPDALTMTCALIAHVADVTGAQTVTDSPHMLSPASVSDVCKLFVDRACAECGNVAVSDLFGLLAAAHTGSLTIEELRHLLFGVPFPGERAAPLALLDQVPPSAVAGGRGAVGAGLLSWGKWMMLHHCVAPLLAPCGAAGLHTQTLALLHRNFSSYALQRFHPRGVPAALHVRLGAYYRGLADPEGALTWRGAAQERALLALPHHLRGADKVELAALLLLDMGYVSACVHMGQTRNLMAELQQSMHRDLVDPKLGAGQRVALAQMLLWLARSALALARRPSLVFQSAANEREGSAPQRLALRRLRGGWEGTNWLRHLLRHGAPDSEPPELSTMPAAHEDGDTTSAATEPVARGTKEIHVPHRCLVHHRGGVRCVTSSRCGSLWAAAGDDGAFVILTTSGRRIATFGHTEERGRRPRACAAALSPDSTLLATASLAGGVHLYDVRTGIECASCVVKKTLTAQGVAQAQRRREQEAAAARLNPAGVQPTPDPWGYVVTSLVFARSGRALLAGAADGNCHVFDVASSDCVRLLLNGHTLNPENPVAVRCLGWSLADGMVAAGVARQIILWRTSDLGDGKGTPQHRTVAAERALHRHSGNVNSVAWAPEDLVLASGADDGLVCLWDMTRLLVPPGDSSTEFARISSAGLGLGDGDGVGAHAREGRGAGKECQGALDVVTLEGHQAPVLALCFTSSGRVVVAADFSGAVLLWSRASCAVLFRLSGLTGPVSSVCMADGDATILTGCSDGSLRAWDIRSILPTPPPAGEYCADEAALAALTTDALPPCPSSEPDPFHSGRVTAVEYAPGNKHLVSAGSDGRLAFRHAASGRALAPPSLATPHPAGLFAARFVSAHQLSGGGHLLTAAGDGAVVMWDVRAVFTGASHAPSLCRRYIGHSGAALAVGSNPVCPQLVSSAKDGSVRLWDMETGSQIARLNAASFSAGHGDSTCLDWSACGSSVLTAGGANEVWLWDVRSCKPARRLVAAREVVCASLNATGNEVVGGLADGHVRVWEASGGKVLHDAQYHSAAVMGCRFSRRGAHVVSAGGDGVALIIDAFDWQVVGQWVSPSGMTAVDTADIRGGYLVLGDEDGRVTTLATSVGICGRWRSL